MSVSAYPASAKTAMRFVGRTFVRLRNIQRRSKQRVDSVQLTIQGDKLIIDVEGRIVVSVVKGFYGQWDIEITQKLNNLLALENVAVL